MDLKAKLKNQLLAELSRRNTDLITQWVIDQPEGVDFLVDLVLQHSEKVSPRATWVLEKVSEKLHKPAQHQMVRILKELTNITSSSTRRTLAKVLMLHDIPEAFEGEMLDYCISMIEDPKEPVAVKANCMTIVFNLLPKYPDLKNEIFAIIEDQIPHNTIGFKSRFTVLKRKMKP